MRITITSNVDAITRKLESAARRQVPFATALGLTMTVRDVQRHLIDTLPEYFEIRSRWVERSIRITPARKGPDPIARVGSTYGPMRGHAEGERRRARGELLGLPHRARSNKTQRTTRSRWPEALMRRPKEWGYFITNKGPSRRGQALLFKRSGRGGKKLRLWWVLTEQVEIKPRWPFERLANEVVAREARDNFFAALERALL